MTDPVKVRDLPNREEGGPQVPDLPERETGAPVDVDLPQREVAPVTGPDLPDREPDPGADVMELRLYVAGQTPRSLAALRNLRRICEEHLKGRYRIEIVDLMEHPELAKSDQIVAIPTLVRKLPVPIRRIVGDLSNTEKALVGLSLAPRSS